jgi:hypothetical protein
MPKAHTRKAKRTFSLSRDVVSYLEAMQKEKRGKSLSAILEEIILRQQQLKEMDRISASVTSYYDSISEEERAENRAWGKFSESQLGRED